MAAGHVGYIKFCHFVRPFVVVEAEYLFQLLEGQALILKPFHLPYGYCKSQCGRGLNAWFSASRPPTPEHADVGSV